MKRRSFIKSGSILTAPLILGGVPVSAIAENTFSAFLNGDSDRVLVLIQLNGGNDGLNCVIPRDQYDKLTLVRPEVVIPENDIIGITDTVGFHPSMTGMQSIYDEGRLSIVQSVGYPDQNRSHFRSTDIWHTASGANEFLNTGWIGRYLDAFYAGYPENYPNSDCPDPFALTIGSSVSETCQGLAGNFSLAVVDPDNLGQLSTPVNNDLAGGCYAEKLSFLNKTIEQTNAYGDTIQQANDLGMNASSLYKEDDELAQKLKLVAKLIKGGLRTKVYVVSLGGFDTHAEQVVEGETQTGEHAALLQSLSDAIYAFQDDLKALQIDERVLGMTYSEFGRRIRSNASFGTDHGTAAPLFVFGSCVAPGVLGDNPEISEDVDIKEGVPMQYDFRAVYGSVLVDWFEVDESIVKDVLLGDFQKIPILKVCGETSSERNIINQNLDVKVFPNPFQNIAQIEFETKNERTKISVFDAVGSEIRVLANRKFSAGKHQLKFEAHRLPPGTYFFRIQTETGQKTKRIVKIR